MNKWLLLSLLTALVVNEDVSPTQINQSLTEATWTVLSNDLPQEERSRLPASESINPSHEDKESMSEDSTKK